MTATRFQRTWLIIFWTAVGNAGVLFVIATANLFAGTSEFVNWATAGLGATASVLAAVQAQRLRRLGASDLWFAKGTSAGRVIALGWVAVLPLIVFGGVASVLFELDAESITGPVGGVLNSLGAVALVAMLGPGYTEYREAAHLTAGDEDGRALAEYRRRTLRSQPSHSETLPRE